MSDAPDPDYSDPRNPTGPEVCAWFGCGEPVAGYVSSVNAFTGGVRTLRVCAAHLAEHDAAGQG